MASSRVRGDPSYHVIDVEIVLKCANNKCTSMSHRNEIDIYYNKLSCHLLQFSYESIPVNKKTYSSYIIPGFNDYVRYHVNIMSSGVYMENHVVVTCKVHEHHAYAF